MKITVLGSTGSVGVNTLNVIAQHPEKFSVFALTAHQNAQLLLEQCLQFKPSFAVLSDPIAAKSLRENLQEAKLKTEVLLGAEALASVASDTEVDTVIAAIVGAAGLLPTLAAAKAGKRILLANKEALVMSGAIFMQAVFDNQAILLPLDSEHNAIFQCMPRDYLSGSQAPGIKRILLTASGGALRDLPLDQLARVTPQQACAHPNWKMGRKITIDCATMVNKGLEVIEAHWLFQMPAAQIDILLHPQSIVHSLVEYIDGSVLAQMGNPDMRTPIAQALAWPERIDAGVEALDLIKINTLEFYDVPANRYPALKLAYDALEEGGTATTIFNAANEVAVAAFLDEKIPFLKIVEIIQETLNSLPSEVAKNLDVILKADAKAREIASNLFFC
jgi:1-deoxy-D-xylulose-5-phosphate reductoisomerase